MWGIRGEGLQAQLPKGFRERIRTMFQLARERERELKILKAWISQAHTITAALSINSFLSSQDCCPLPKYPQQWVPWPPWELCHTLLWLLHLLSHIGPARYHWAFTHTFLICVKEREKEQGLGVVWTSSEILAPKNLQKWCLHDLHLPLKTGYDETSSDAESKNVEPVFTIIYNVTGFLFL